MCLPNKMFLFPVYYGNFLGYLIATPLYAVGYKNSFFNDRIFNGFSSLIPTLWP